jgi:apolipoprotein N-acyltransferase
MALTSQQTKVLSILVLKGLGVVLLFVVVLAAFIGACAFALGKKSWMDLAGLITTIASISFGLWHGFRHGIKGEDSGGDSAANISR